MHISHIFIKIFSPATPPSSGTAFCFPLSRTPRGGKLSDPPPLPPKPFPFHGRRKKTLSLFLLLLLFGKRAFPGLNGGWREREGERRPPKGKRGESFQRETGKEGREEIFFATLLQLGTSPPPPPPVCVPWEKGKLGRGGDGEIR